MSKNMSKKSMTKTSAKKASFILESRVFKKNFNSASNNRFNIAPESSNKISESTKQDINMYLSTDKSPERKQNVITNKKKGTISNKVGITEPEFYTIANIIINNTKQGLVHKTLKFFSGQSNNITRPISNTSNDKITPRQVLKELAKGLPTTNITDINPDKRKEMLNRYISFLQGILNEKSNFKSLKPFNIELTLYQPEINTELIEQTLDDILDDKTESSVGGGKIKKLNKNKKTKKKHQ